MIAPEALRLRTTALLILASVALLSFAACGGEASEPDSGTNATSGAPAPQVNATSGAPAPQVDVAPWKRDLLDLCFTHVSRFPLQGHEKNRALAQYEIAQAALETGLRDEARRWAGAIPNWRQGQALANCSLADALQGNTEHRASLEARVRSRVEQILADNTEQGWRADRALDVLKSIDLVVENTGEIPAALKTAELPSALRIEAYLMSEKAARAALGELETEVPVGNPDVVKPHLDTAAAVFERFYDDKALRKRIRGLVETASSKLPLQIQLEARLNLADAAHSRGDDATAREILAATQTFGLGFQWQLQDEMRFRGDLGRRQAAVGDREAAQAHLDEMLRLYDEKHTTIWDIHHATCLRATAEVADALGRDVDARDAYARALEAGVKNPNSRPRAFDLARTCISMIRADLAPLAEMRERIKTIAEGLGEPW